MRRAAVFMLLVAMIGGCQMRYGYLPRVHHWSSKEKSATPRQTDQKPAAGLQPEAVSVPEQVAHIPRPEAVQDSIYLSLEYPAIRLEPDDNRLPLVRSDSPRTEEKDTLSGENVDSTEHRKKSALKVVFFVLMLAANIAALLANSFLLLFFFTVLSIVMMLTVLEKRKYPEIKDPGSRGGSSQPRNVLNTGLILLGAGLILLVMGFFSFSEMMVVMGFLMLFAGLIVSIVGLATLGGGNSRKDQNTGLALALVLALLVVLLITLLSLFLLAILFL